MGFVDTLKKYANDRGIVLLPSKEYVDTGGGWKHPPFYSVDAYHPRDRGNSAGATHIETRDTIKLGRIKRDPRQVLCTRKRHWQLLANDSDITCPKCLEIAERFGLVIGQVHR